jgi:hypothetical protein
VSAANGRPTRDDWITWAIASALQWAVVVPLSMAMNLKHVWPGPLLMTGIYGALYLRILPRVRRQRMKSKSGTS